MSKLARIRMYQSSPAAGSLWTGLLNIGKSIIGLPTSAPAQTVSKVAQVKAVATKGAKAIGKALPGAVSALTAGYGGGGGAVARVSSGGGFGTHRRGRGITARELRGYRKVANLLHKEGMVSKRSHLGHRRH